MGLLTQIVNKLLSTQEQGAIGWENPLNTPQGQIQIGVSESQLQYYARKRLLKEKILQEFNVPTTSFTEIISTSPLETGKTVYGLKVILGASGSGMATVSYKKDDGLSKFIYFFIPANQTISINIDGAAWCTASTGIQLNFRPDVANTKVSGVLYYVEV